MIDYGHGDDVYKYQEVDFKANFSSNVWYNGAPEKLLTYLQEQLKSIENYPAPSAENLAQLIEKHHALSSHSTIVTNGATEAFYLIANAFHSSSVTICSPSFSEYEQACIANKLEIKFIKRKTLLDHQFDTQLAFICNPNNPDGFENTIEELDALTSKFPKTIFIIDEAYTEFTSSNISCISLLEKRNNIVLIKSLTKLFCIPGLRLGYILAVPELISKLLKHKMPWNINSIALSAGEFLFRHYNELTPNFDTCIKNTKKLKNAINELYGFKVHSANTSYFLIELIEPKASELKSYLIQEHQLLIRNASNFRTLNERYIRVASQTSEKNELLINALKQWKF
ncbi:threonine-phosphate decarboxylase [Tenacibaculum sp. MAR_2009_124]|uniref:pyridoxal phosphate-dependent aminotransferase n=1 Tax=Tenacibaculum sp. MAR_2009_124 TaxID=1250059 RepID=UPI00089469E8|nr:aminotransferase class I/II-fold pyridoxal phosphate-dependent enzyme [Tenacibaculum sp. MAR_2009_124]SEB87687.1 threonine-phosphate decarboxylase [Tenacibaculum sp. MAR_2009_124]